MKDIKELLDTYNGELYDLCYEILKKSDDEETFEFVCLTFTKDSTDKSKDILEYFTKTEIEELKTILGDIVDGFINSVAKKCDYGLLAPDQYYKTLWQLYCNNFTTKREKAFALYFTIIDKQIPYRYIGKPLSMSNEEFKTLLDKNIDSVETIKYILNSSYTQKTERISLLLNCINKIDDFESKVVVLARAIDYMSVGRVKSNLRIDDLLQEIDKKITDLEKEEKE